MKLTSIIASTAFAASVFGSPTPSPQNGPAVKCGQSDSFTAGPYTVIQNLWGASSVTSGQQCTTFGSLSGSTLSWSTSWTWEGALDSVKSFANVVFDEATNRQLCTISSIPSSWDWTYTGTNLVADVAYDLFTSSTADGNNEFEIMIRLGAFGGAPLISATGSAIAFPLLSGTSWELFEGTNGTTTVFSFVADANDNNFSGDINDFLKFLVEFEALSDQQILKNIGAGTEAFTGLNAEFDVQAFTLSIV